MSLFGKLFKVQSAENHEAFLNSLGLPAEKLNFFNKFTPNQKFEKSGDDYICTFTTPRGDKPLKFTSGVEFEDKAGDMLIKNIFTVDGDNAVTHVMKFEPGLIITTKMQFAENKMVMELTNNKWDGVAYVTYTT